MQSNKRDNQINKITITVLPQLNKSQKLVAQTKNNLNKFNHKISATIVK